MRSILVIEDVEINREILAEILGDQFFILQAANGQEGLELLRKRKDIAAVILDLIMPVMNGFEFMEKVAELPIVRSIPIIVASEHGAVENEKKALEMGAYDFVTKPYEARIVKLRVRNAVEHSRLAALERLQYLQEYDPLTGIYNKQSFMETARDMMDHADEEVKFAIVRFDITRFSMVNAYYGMEEGDNVLKHMAEVLKKESLYHDHMSYGRLGSDDFALCVPFEGENELYEITDRIRSGVGEYRISFNLVLIFGIYVISDRNAGIESMIDNANAAAKQIKGNFVNTVAFYDDRLTEKRNREQGVINEMKHALEDEQFLVYLQPKYDSEAGLPCGAEALIRWKHPEKGLIPPGLFIPVFESNGFVEPVDHYMWEHVCILLRKWLDQGIEPNPVSVNVSRVNLFNPHIVEEIEALTDKYEVPKRLLQLEITESAYTDNGDMILGVINKFHDAGFTILMDDFGSGYSSLNVLKDMHVDVLKIDMKFFGKTENLSRAETIVSSVVRMAKWLNIATVAEGVETRDQVEFLKSIGCVTIQGYYYAKPMPVEEYEALVKSGVKFVSKEDEHGADAFVWANSPEINELFDNILEPICLVEVADDTIESLRVNQAYYDLFGYENRIMFSKSPVDRAVGQYREKLNDAYRAVASAGGTETVRYDRVSADGNIVTVDVSLKRLKAFENRSLLLATFDQVLAEPDSSDDEEQIERIIDMCRAQNEQNGGVYAPFIPGCNHMMDMVNTVLRVKFAEKHALILISAELTDGYCGCMDNGHEAMMWNSIEVIINQYFRTARNIRNNDMIAHTGEHEYCVFMTSVPSEDMVSHKCHELSHRLTVFSRIAKVSALRFSIGVAVSNSDDRDYERLYNMAREAVRRCGEQSGNRVYMLTGSNY